LTECQQKIYHILLILSRLVSENNWGVLRRESSSALRAPPPREDKIAREEDRKLKGKLFPPRPAELSTPSRGEF